MSDTLLETTGKGKEPDSQGKGSRGKYFICKVVASFETKKDTVAYIERHFLEDEVVIRGKEKIISRESVPVVDIH